MKVVHREVYQVNISLGWDPDNIVWSQPFIGVPTKEKITACLEDVLGSLHRSVNIQTGLPGNELNCLILDQCLFLVSTFETPKAGLSTACIGYSKIIGHIVINKSTNVIQVD